MPFDLEYANEVHADIEQHYQRQIADCWRIRDYAYGLFKTWSFGSIDDTPDALVVSILARSTDTFSCGVHLATQGYRNQAAMLNRSLFEDMVDAHWIATDPETAQQRYGQHHHHARMLLADAVRKYPEFFADVDIPSFDAAERERLDAIYTKYGTRPWSKLNIHERVRLVEHHWSDEDRRLLRFMLDFEHKANNDILHVSASSLDASVAGLAEDRALFHLGPRSDDVRKAMYGSFWTFAQTLGLVIDHFSIPFENDARTEFFALRNFHDLGAEQLRGVGRNNPCPCGSGLKFKRCHAS
jgi:hypothetical protein